MSALEAFANSIGIRNFEQFVCDEVDLTNTFTTLQRIATIPILAD